MSYRQLQDALADALLDREGMDCAACAGSGLSDGEAVCVYCNGSGYWPPVAA